MVHMSDIVPETASDTENPSDWKYDLLMDSLLVLGVGLNVYILADMATDGAVSRKIVNVMHNARIKMGVLLHRNDVIQEAHEALYEIEDEP